MEGSQKKRQIFLESSHLRLDHVGSPGAPRRACMVPSLRAPRGGPVARCRFLVPRVCNSASGHYK
eukprot:6470749-Prymnesium_polylepis.1